MVQPIAADMESMVSKEDNMNVEILGLKLKSLRFQVLTSEMLRWKLCAFALTRKS